MARPVYVWIRGSTGGNAGETHRSFLLALGPALWLLRHRGRRVIWDEQVFLADMERHGAQERWYVNLLNRLIVIGQHAAPNEQEDE